LKYWNEFRKQNTPEISDEEQTSVAVGAEEKNEQLIRLYKQTYERSHPGVQLSFMSEGKGKSDKTTTTSSPGHSKTHKAIVSLKDVLAGKAELKEDSDEDQFEESEEIATTTTTVTPAPAKIMTHESLLPKKKVVEDDNADDTDEDDLEEDGYVESNDKKASGKKDKDDRTIRVAIEPILHKAPNEDEVADRGVFARQDLLVVTETEDEYQQQSYVSKWVSGTQANFALALLLSACIVLGVSILMKRRNRHPGFIEVDVCSPDDRHVNGLQINGYENPTYAHSFYEAKA